VRPRPGTALAYAPDVHPLECDPLRSSLAGSAEPPPLRLVVFSSIAPEALNHLLWRFTTDLPEIVVAGVLYEAGRPPLSRAKRVRRFLKLLRHRDFLVYAAQKTRCGFEARVADVLDAALRFIHAAPAHPNGPSKSLEQVIGEWTAQGIAFEVTRDLHADHSLAFVRRLNADVGLIYGTRILAPKLFTIPRRGTINIHKHKVPDYRGSGAAGVWELRDGRTEQTVTVHRVVEDVDAGAILGERTFPIEPFDTLESVQLKADVIGVDLIVDVLRDEQRGSTVEHPQPAGGCLFKGWQPHQVHAVECRIRASRPRWRPGSGRSRAKLLARIALLPALAVRNHRRRGRKQFPVTVLYHHLTCDRPKHMGLPTAQFARHVRYLKKHYRIASLSQAVAMLQRGEVVAPTVVLTLDDGYADNFVGLRAIVETERIPVTLCVCTDHVTERTELLHDVARGERGFASMGWDQVRYLDRHGVTIASHTRSHFDCGSDADALLTAEIVGSKRELESRLGHAVDAFAFPKGRPANISPLAYQIARRHYAIIMSAAGGPNLPPLDPPIELRRYSHPDSLLELELQVQEILDRPVPPRPVPGELWDGALAGSRSM
jgi:peptidoglycan/xylan/chitin deacetylase (PgdA/CDA1 family)/folate-dependent phosphoribosylglycinamide formyltransferase PurN